MTKTTLNFNKTIHSLPVGYFAVQIHVFRTLAPSGQNISNCSDTSHFEQAADIIINPMTGNPTVCGIKRYKKYPLLTVADMNFYMSFCF
jgi:hypothetical protein